MATERTLLQGGVVLTLDKDIGNFHKADVLIEGSKIAKVGPNLNSSGAENIDASDMIIMPGFVDAHRHTWQSVLRTSSGNSNSEQPNNLPLNLHKSYSSAFRPEDVYTGNFIGALSALDAGITTLVDWSDIQVSKEHTDEAVRALVDAGIRAVFSYGLSAKAADFSRQKVEIEKVEKEYFSTSDQLLSLALAAPGPEFSDFDLSLQHWELARSMNVRISTHIGVGDFGMKKKLQTFNKLNAIGEETTFVHCTTLSNEEIQLIADSGALFTIAVAAEMMTGFGMPPIKQFIDRGIKPSLSIDSEVNTPGDMFSQMRTLISLQHAVEFDRVLSSIWSIPDMITTRDVIQFATIQGARAAGLGDRVGTLTPGKQADMLMLRANRINIMPVNDPIGAVVWGMDSSNIDSVFVAGKALKRHGRLLGVDMDQVREMAATSRDHVLKKTVHKPARA